MGGVLEIIITWAFVHNNCRDKKKLFMRQYKPRIVGMRFKWDTHSRKFTNIHEKNHLSQVCLHTWHLIQIPFHNPFESPVQREYIQYIQRAQVAAEESRPENRTSSYLACLPPASLPPLPIAPGSKVDRPLAQNAHRSRLESCGPREGGGLAGHTHGENGMIPLHTGSTCVHYA